MSSPRLQQLAVLQQLVGEAVPLQKSVPLPGGVEVPLEAEAHGLPVGGKDGEVEGHPPIQADTKGSSMLDSTGLLSSKL